MDADAQVRHLTDAMSAGDADAVDRFYRRYFELLFGEARRATRRDEAFCLDVVQDAVLRIIRTVRRAESEAQFAVWLRLVVRTTAYDLLRREARRRQREKATAKDGPLSAAEPAEQESQLVWLRARIESLDPQIVRMIELRFTRKWRLSRIADALGLSIATVDGRIRRALLHLRELAREQLDD